MMSTVLKHTCLQPLSDQAQHDTVLHSQTLNLAQLGVVQRAEEVTNVCFEHPATPHPHQSFPKSTKCAMRGSLRSEAVTTWQEVRLVDRLQNHRDTSLQHLVLVGRNPDRSRSPIPFRD